MHAVEEHTEADPAGVLGSLLTYYGALCGGWTRMYADKPHQANLFTALVGDTSRGRKGVADDVASAIIALVEPNYRRLLVSGLGSGEALVGHLKRLQADDAAEHRALVRASELSGLLTVMAREGQVLSQILRDAFDGQPLGRFLADREKQVDFHHVAIIGHVTPADLASKLTTVERANGFGNRFLWLAVKKQRSLPRPRQVDELVAGKYTKLALGLDAARRDRILRWSTDAEKLWDAYYTAFEQRPNRGTVAVITARQQAQLVRVALIYALAESADTVGPGHFEAAKAVVEYAERSARYVFGNSTGNGQADALVRMLRHGEMSRVEAFRELRVRTASDMDAIEDLLVELDLIRVVEVSRPGGGRPKKLYRPNFANFTYFPGGTHANER